MNKNLTTAAGVFLFAALATFAPSFDAHAQAPPCVVPDNGSGTVTLPPAGCNYLSPSDVHMIINGLPAGTTVQLTGIHRDFVCHGAQGTPPAACDFTPSPACEQPGGTLGGQEECADSNLNINLQGTGTLSGWSRTLSIPVSFETHVGPRTPGQPVQQFATDMYRLQGQLPPGDPDFDLLRITGGTSNGYPSPGQTKLTNIGGGNWSVDSFFDITYRIDFTGHAGGHLDGFSGSTVGTIHMATGSGACVPANCDDGNACTVDTCDNATGQCVHTAVSCDDGQICTDDFCDPATGACSHGPANCDDGNPCTVDSCVQALVAPQCLVPDNGSGTATLPPAGCDYLSPSDVHQIINGLPAGTTIQLGAIHKNFICSSAQPGGVCSFPAPIPGVDCDQPGGSLGGEEECANSQLSLTLHGTGTLAGWNRTVPLQVSFETHVAPRTPNAATQSFDTEMFRLFGQLPPGDPDFDLLRVTAGNDFGLPSPGHTTLRKAGTNWQVDSFFDITYRIDFVGHPGGHIGGMSGSTTATIRMQTGSGVGCVHTPVVCNDNNPCTDDACNPATGTCVYTNNNANACSDGNACTQDVCNNGVCGCPTVTDVCVGSTAISYDSTDVPKAIAATGTPTVTSTLTVSGAGPYLYDINAKTFITHTSSGQLQITLKSPAGTIVTLSSNNGGTNDNVFNGTLWDDSADPGNQAPFSADTFAASNLVTDTVYTNLTVKPTLVPEEALGAFIGENPNGVWTITVADQTTADGGSLDHWSLAIVTLPVVPNSTVTNFTATDVPKAISATGTPVVTSTLNVATAGTQIGRVRIKTNITHTFDADLDITLKSPKGTIVTLTTDNAGSNDNNFNGTLWDDKADPGNQAPYVVPLAASNLVTDTVYTNLTVKPTLVPEEHLAAFVGENPNGAWLLTISDDAGGDGGNLAAWTLEITTTTCTQTVCAVNCDDGNPCTDDSCNPATGCVHTPNNNACNDGNACTSNDHCSGGTCGGTATVCDDGNVCTTDSCNPATGICSFVNNTNACSDGNPCTVGDTCGAPPTNLTQNFDGVAAPALPAGWTSTVTAGTNPWVTTTAFSVTPPNSATTDETTTVSDKTLDSPAFTAVNTTIEFENKVNLEESTSTPGTAFDGAVLEVKIGAGSFTDILAAGGSFVTGGYTHTVSTGFSSPIAGRQAWSGATAGFVHVKANLPAAAVGQSVVLRFRVASDSSLAATAPNGQWIDVSPPTSTCQPGAANTCDDGNACTTDSCAQGLLSPACTVPDNGGGTVTLPPAGCDYLSPSDVHQIINGLPAGTTIQFGAIHKDFICHNQAGTPFNCSFTPPPGLCEQPGGSLGGNEECSSSTLQLQLTGTGTLSGWSRSLAVPIDFETHVAPRTPGAPVQSFDTEMFALQGQLPPGDPDFDLLRITAGNNFGLPSPGHTTLRKQAGSNWNVDSFFDITYRIDFVGHPGGHIGGMSGSTTATIRMATGNNDPCVHQSINCDDGNPCTLDGCDPASGCFHTPVNCDDGQVCTTDTCDPATGQCVHTPVNCDDGNACTQDSCIQALVAPACDVPDNGSGTVTLPPAGCPYLSPQDVHDIINGLPAGTTIQFAAIHQQFICKQNDPASICSFPPPPGCEQAGGTLGGREECSTSTLSMTLHGTGTLAGWDRPVSIPVSFETHVGPRTPGAPFQSFDTEMFRLQGQLPPGDPDFDLLRITAGNDFGLPSPGHTTLQLQPDGSWHVDSFFDITYRIDFVGHAGGHVGGMSGSTTGTIRMQTGSGVGCVHSQISCDDGNPCTLDDCDPVSGCTHTPVNCNDNNACTTDACNPATGTCTHTPIDCDDGQICTVDSCDPATGQCAHSPLNCDDGNACTQDACVQGLASPACTVPDNGGGTVTLPPAGCPYLSPQDVHQIINGLPAGTTIRFGASHQDFICRSPQQGGICSFTPPPGTCDQPGGTLGGREECNTSTLALTLNGTGVLTGWTRSLAIPVSFETHVGPRTPGNPVQSFATDMFALQGQLPPGDPDFDLLRITAGDSFGLPSPGHTTLTQVGANWKVDSFFDITYRIDFVGHAGGHVGGMSGSTTATIRMQTGTGVGCVHTAISCNDNNVCTDDGCDPASGCFHNNNTAGCDDGNGCTINDTCSGGTCTGTTITPPAEAQNVKAPNKTTFTWTATPSATRYDVVRGATNAFPVGPGGGDEICFDNLAGPTVTDAANPAPGAGFWYLSRAENTCGNGIYGFQGNHGAPGAPRITTTCP